MALTFWAFESMVDNLAVSTHNTIKVQHPDILQNISPNTTSCLMFVHQTFWRQCDARVQRRHAHARPSDYLWFSEAAQFSEVYSSTLFAVVCKTTIVWSPCSTHSAGHWCFAFRITRRWNIPKTYSSVYPHVIHTLLWFIHRWAATQRRYYVASWCETSCKQELLLFLLIHFL